jgi:hypothetical protein
VYMQLDNKSEEKPCVHMYLAHDERANECICIRCCSIGKTLRKFTD